jgi:hypothetical protein
MLSRPSIVLATCALALGIFNNRTIAAPFPSDASSLGTRSADTSPADGLWASSTIILEPEAEPDFDADVNVPELHRRIVVQADISRVSDTGVAANCQWRWLSKSTLDQAHCTVGDTSCDKHEVYAFLQVGGKNGYKEIGRINNDKGCHGGVVRDPKANTWRDGLGEIYRARVRACVDDNGLKNTCYSGNWVSNPN